MSRAAKIASGFIAAGLIFVGPAFAQSGPAGDRVEVNGMQMLLRGLRRG